jgi:HAUS augmin-like complex subunit 5
VSVAVCEPTGDGAVDANGNKVTIPSPQTMLNELHKQQKRIAEFEATVTQQQRQIQALVDGLQKVNAQLEANKPIPRVVANSQ